MYAALLESARILTKYGKERRVRFLIENHVLSAHSGEAGRRLLPMVTAEELSRLARDVNDSNFGILVDVGHLNVSARTLGLDRHRFIDTLAPHIAAFHLSDNDGVTDQHLPFANDAWFLPRLRDVPDATVTLELTNLEIDQMLSVRDLVLKWL